MIEEIYLTLRIELVDFKPRKYEVKIDLSASQQMAKLAIFKRFSRKVTENQYFEY
jgi:hypothetical protein